MLRWARGIVLLAASWAIQPSRAFSGIPRPPADARPSQQPVAQAVLDLNSAGAAELAALPGMGPVYARRVIEGRPYSAKNQLVTRGVLPRETYERIKDHVVAHRPVPV